MLDLQHVIGIVWPQPTWDPPHLSLVLLYDDGEQAAIPPSQTDQGLINELKQLEKAWALTTQTEKVQPIYALAELWEAGE